MNAAISHPQSGDTAIANAAGQPRKRRTRGAPVLSAQGPFGLFTVTGQTARALVALVKAGPAGVTALEVNSWAFRKAAYVHRLRKDNGLAIETVREKHDGGWHARYVLCCPVTLLEAGQ
ncbi:hypothetical protein [Sandarakinorhabdus sp.]|uniref:winged helix domain-containing protein n=1 Tax=Sandarakinorhabdus sp. TaxID=1916663 RepID=UPI00333FF3E8